MGGVVSRGGLVVLVVNQHHQAQKKNNKHLLVGGEEERRWDFKESYLTVSPAETQKAVMLNLRFTTRFPLNATDAIWVTLPRFTSGSGSKTPGPNLGRDQVDLAPSVYFQGEWLEGNYESGEAPYPNSTLVLYVRGSRWIESGKQLDVTVYETTGLKAYCGMEPASRNPDLGLRMRTNSSYGNGDPVLVDDSDMVGRGCTAMLDCLDRGVCNFCTERCECYERLGDGNGGTARGSVTSVDCTLSNCPSGVSWSGMPWSHDAARVEATCSDAGLCEEQTGQCVCFDGFEGSACERTTCENDCSGHGQCLTVSEIAFQSHALPLTASTDTIYGTHARSLTSAWDHEFIRGCVCDSKWPVGLGPNDVQTPEYDGADCSRRHCPSGDDPSTSSRDETDCSNVTAASGFGVGLDGNLCHHECSGRGKCDIGDTDFGKCACFSGYIGANCDRLVANAGAVIY